MNARRSSTKATIRLETLEDRITPVAIEPSLAYLASTRDALLSRTNPSLHPGSAPQLNLYVIQGHRQLPVTVSITTNAPSHKTPQRIHPSFGAVSSVGEPAPVPAPVVLQPVLRSFTLPSAPSRRPVAVAPGRATDRAARPQWRDDDPVQPSVRIHGYSADTGHAGPESALHPAVNLSQVLQAIDQEFEAAGGEVPFTTSSSRLIPIQGTSVGVETHGKAVDFNTLAAEREKLGSQINATDATIQEIDGVLPTGRAASWPAAP
jgi:hypothetical protein